MPDVSFGPCSISKRNNRTPLFGLIRVAIHRGKASDGATKDRPAQSCRDLVMLGRHGHVGK